VRHDVYTGYLENEPTHIHELPPDNVTGVIFMSRFRANVAVGLLGFAVGAAAMRLVAVLRARHVSALRSSPCMKTEMVSGATLALNPVSISKEWSIFHS
jgi:hypothetical protein